MENKKFKKLVFKKEMLVSLQQKQMKAIIGGEQVYSGKGQDETRSYTCGAEGCCSIILDMPKEEFESCCKQSCNN